jgi:hypothetical protein
MKLLRFLIRLMVLGLAAYGAKTLYDMYAPRLRSMQGPASEFTQRTEGIVENTAERTRQAAREGAGALTDAADELRRAADDAKDEAARRMTQGSASPSDTPLTQPPG